MESNKSSMTSFFRRGRSNKSSADVNLFPEKGKSKLGLSVSSEARNPGSTSKMAEEVVDSRRMVLEVQELRLSLAQEELRACREQLTMRQAEHAVRMELLQLQLEALQTLAAKGPTTPASPTTIVGYFQV